MQPGAEIKSSDMSLELPSISYCSKRRDGELRQDHWAVFPPVPAPPLPVTLRNSPISAAAWRTLPVLPTGSRSLASLSPLASRVSGLFPSGLVRHYQEPISKVLAAVCRSQPCQEKPGSACSTGTNGSRQGLVSDTAKETEATGRE